MSLSLDVATETKVVIVDGDDSFRAHILSYLTRNGYTVLDVASSVQLDEILSQTAVDLVILDILLPGEDGLSICRRLAQGPGPSVILLSAMADEVDRIVGLEMGADDYVSKSCNPRELLARIRAVLRRRTDDETPERRRGKTIYKFNGFLLDISRRELKAPNGAIILLTEREFSLLGLFLSNPKTVMSREELIQSIYGPDSAMDHRAIDVQVGRLRRKLEACHNEPIIKTHRGAGYMLVCDVVKT
jgi:two-component system OmpR family response regulator